VLVLHCEHTASGPLLFYCHGARRDLHSFPTRRSSDLRAHRHRPDLGQVFPHHVQRAAPQDLTVDGTFGNPELLYILVQGHGRLRSEEHTSELQSLTNLVSPLLLENKINLSSHHTASPP